MPACSSKRTSRTGAKYSLEEALDCFRASRCPSWTLSTYLGGQDGSEAALKPRGRRASRGNLLPQQHRQGLLWVLRTTREVLWDAVGTLRAAAPMGQGLGTMGPALAAASSGCFEPYEPRFAKQLGMGGDAGNKSRVSSTRTSGPGNMRRTHPLRHQTQRRKSCSCSGTRTRPSRDRMPPRLVVLLRGKWTHANRRPA